MLTATAVSLTAADAAFKMDPNEDKEDIQIVKKADFDDGSFLHTGSISPGG